MSGRCYAYLLPNTETGCFGTDKQRSPGAGSQMNPTKSKAFCGYSTLGIVVWETTEHCVLYQKKKLLNDYVRFIPLNPVVFKVVGLNSLVVRQFWSSLPLQWHQAVSERFSKSVPACVPRHPSFSTISPPPRPIRSYGPFERIQADIVDMAPGKKRSLFMTNNRVQYPYFIRQTAG